VVKSFWVEEYSKYPQQFQVEAIAPIQNKVGQFLSTALIRNVVGQVKSTIDLRHIMDNKKILIMNLSKGRIGEDSSALLGAMMITKIQLAAMSRIDVPEKERKDFYLYVDEFQNFATESFANILSEARKYRLDLTIGHQYIEQLEEDVEAAVFGNVGTIMCFRVGAADAEFLATEFAPYFTEEDLVNLTKFDIYMKLMINGVASNPFSATTFPPLGKEHMTDNKEKVINVSRERYAKPREVVEDKISRWSGVMNQEEIERKVDAEPPERWPKKKKKRKPAEGVTPKDGQRSAAGREERTERPERKSRRKEKTTYTINCYECGKPTEVSFKPDGVRPIYCQACFQKTRERLMHGEAEEVEMKEVKPTETKEISLSEALAKEPQSIDKKRDSKTNKVKKVLPENKKPTLKELVTQKKEPEVREELENNNPKTLEPGQVVKL
jgi:CxxC-x17-CxxC domain-containing protein